MARHFIFINDKTKEEKLANIMVSISHLDEMLSLWLTNHFLRIDDTKKNEKDRDDFEKLILRELTFRKKGEIVSKMLGDKSGVDKFKSKLRRVGEIRNSVAHKTGLLGIPNDIEKLYKEFDELMSDLESFIELVYHEYQGDMDYAYINQYKK